MTNTVCVARSDLRALLRHHDDLERRLNDVNEVPVSGNRSFLPEPYAAYQPNPNDSNFFHATRASADRHWLDESDSVPAVERAMMIGDDTHYSGVDELSWPWRIFFTPSGWAVVVALALSLITIGVGLGVFGARHLFADLPRPESQTYYVTAYQPKKIFSGSASSPATSDLDRMTFVTSRVIADVHPSILRTNREASGRVLAQP